VNPGVMRDLLLHLKGKKYFTESVISTDYKTACSVHLKISPQQFSFKGTVCH